MFFDVLYQKYIDLLYNEYSSTQKKMRKFQIIYEQEFINSTALYYKLRSLGGYTPRVFTSLPGREATERLSGFIMTNKQTKKKMHARAWRLKGQERKEKDF